MRVKSAIATVFTLVTPWACLAQGYEVWMTDQNNTAGYSAQNPRGTHGGRIFIWQSEDLENPDGPVNNPFVIDLAEMFAVGGPNNNTGANVVRPHMLMPSTNMRYMAISFVASGHVAVFDAAAKQPKVLFRTSAGAGAARQAHAVTWTTDGQAILVANQNGKLLERINYDPVTDTFTHDTAATLNLATCRTPNGYPCETPTPVNDTDPAYFGPFNRPDNAPICPVTTFNNRVFVTLRGGGLLVVDPTTTPMSIIGEYGNELIGRDGCGGVQIGGMMFLNGGAGTPTTNESEFNIYTIQDSFPPAPGYLPANDLKIRPRHMAGNASPGRDAHGIAATAMGYYLWQFDRLANVAEVYRGLNFEYVNTVDLTAGGLSDDPTPDIVVLSPLGNRMYVALRGPNPQTGAHASAGSTPGMAILTLTHGGAHGRITHVFRMALRNPVNGSEESDPHGITVRLK